MDKLKTIEDWEAHKSHNAQGVDFREVPINGKVSKLEFTIIPRSPIWRAGFKLIDPNGTILPLLSSDSLLFHLGSTPDNDFFGFTAYLNGEHIQTLNKTNTYPDDRILVVRLEINHNNFLNVYVNDSLEFKLSSHLKNPNIREKIALLAWGDDNDYLVAFKNINAKNWKDSQEITKFSQTKSNLSRQLIGNYLSAGRDIVIGGKSINKTIKEKFSQVHWYDNWWVTHFCFPLLVLLVGAYLVYKLGWNNENANTPPQSIPITKTSFIDNVTPKDSPISTTTSYDYGRKQRIHSGDSYVDPKSRVVIGVSNIHVFQTADISITTPESETEYHEGVVPGRVFYFNSDKNKYSLIIKEVNFTQSYIDIILN